MKFVNFFRRENQEDSARKLYISLVEQARQPSFYIYCGVPDTMEGRFDMIAIHAFLVMRRLKKDFDKTADLAQALFDLMFADMDTNLRESGVGDLAVGKRVKKLAKAFYGRVAAYDAGLDVENDNDVLAAALGRNLFRAIKPSEKIVTETINYMRREDASLSGQGLELLMAGEVTFGSAPGAI